MKAAIFGLLAGWSHAVHAQPFYVTVGSVTAGLVLFALLCRALAARFELDGRMSAGPLLVLAAAITCGVCLLWTAVNGVLWAADSPLLGERLLAALVPAGVDAASARELLGQAADAATLDVPGAVSMTVGLLAAGALCLAIAWMTCSALAEMIALELRPEDVLARERREAERRRAIADAEAAARAADGGDADDAVAADAAVVADGAAADAIADATDETAAAADADAEDDEGDDADSAAPRAPLPDDRFGRTYKLVGHFADLLYVENRFVRWQRPLVTTLSLLLGVGVLTGSMGYLPIPMWAATAVVVVALIRNLRTPEDPEAKPGGVAEDEPPERVRASASAFADGLAIALHLQPAPPPPEPAASLDGSSRKRRGHADAADNGDSGGHRLDRDVAATVWRALGVRPRAHHLAAAHAFAARRSVLLATPRGSGRRHTADALSLYTVLADAERVLYLAADPAGATAAAARFARRAEATHWKWNIAVVDLAERAGAIDPTQLQPAIAFADADAVHRRLCGQAERWRDFLSGLGAIVVPDVDGRAGVHAAHLAHVLRRLHRAARRARIAAPALVAPGAEALGDRPGQPSHVGHHLGQRGPRYLLTARPGTRDVARFAERVIGRAVTVIGPARDDTPRREQRRFIIEPGFEPPRDDAARAASAVDVTATTAASAAVHPACAVRDMARAAGFAAELLGYDDVLTDDEAAPVAPVRDADVIIARLAPATVAALTTCALHLGGRRRPTSVLFQPDPGPLGALLAVRHACTPHAPSTAGPDAGPLPGAERGPALVAWPRARAVARRQLRADLGQGPVSVDDLARDFARDLLADELAALRADGHLADERRRVLDLDRGAIGDQHVVTLTDPAGPPPLGADEMATADEPWLLVERATGDVVARLEAARADAHAYPHRLVVARGRRFRVLAPDAQDQRDRRRILCEQDGEPAATRPLREIAIEPVERRTRGERRSRRRGRDPGRDPRSGGDRRQGATRDLGGKSFTLEHRDVAVRERVWGVQRFDLRGRLLDTTRYHAPVRCSYTTRAALLGFTGEHWAELTPEAVRDVARLMSAALPMYLRVGHDDLAIAGGAHQRADRAVRLIAFIDLHPEGAGFAEAVTLDVIRHLALAARALAQRAEHSGPDVDDDDTLDGVSLPTDSARAAADVLAAMLGS